MNEDFLSLRGIVGDAGFMVDVGNTLLDRMPVVGKCAFATKGLLFRGKVRVLMSLIRRGSKSTRFHIHM